MQILKEAKPPTGWRRIVYRLPIRLYRMGLGWLFGHRLMLVNHIGRLSGKRRQVVLEVVNHDAIDAGYVAVAGFGPTAAWYQNVLHTPEVRGPRTATFPDACVFMPAVSVVPWCS